MVLKAHKLIAKARPFRRSSMESVERRFFVGLLVGIFASLWWISPTSSAQQPPELGGWWSPGGWRQWVANSLNSALDLDLIPYEDLELPAGLEPVPMQAGRVTITFAFDLFQKGWQTPQLQQRLQALQSGDSSNQGIARRSNPVSRRPGEDQPLDDSLPLLASNQRQLQPNGARAGSESARFAESLTEDRLGATSQQSDHQRLLSDDLPEWIAQSPDLREKTHRLAVDCLPAESLAESLASGDQRLMEVVRHYLDQHVLVGGSAQAIQQLTPQWIRKHWLFDQPPFDATLHASGATYHQAWLLLEIPPSDRRLVQLWSEESKRRERTEEVALAALTCLVSIGMSSGLLRSVGWLRKRRTGSISSPTGHEVLP
jgi:hypothetical protein